MFGRGYCIFVDDFALPNKYWPYLIRLNSFFKQSFRPAPTTCGEGAMRARQAPRARHLSVLLKQGALDKLRKDRSDRHLHVPLLSGYPGMHRHVLHRELNLDGKTPKLYHLGQAEPDGDSPDVLRRRGPVRQDIARVPEAPALTEEDRSRWVAGSSDSCLAGSAARR